MLVVRCSVPGVRHPQRRASLALQPRPNGAVVYPSSTFSIQFAILTFHPGFEDMAYCSAEAASGSP